MLISSQLTLEAIISIFSVGYTSVKNLLILMIINFLRSQDLIFKIIWITMSLIFLLFILFFSIFSFHISFLFSLYLFSIARSTFYILIAFYYFFTCLIWTTLRFFGYAHLFSLFNYFYTIFIYLFNWFFYWGNFISCSFTLITLDIYQFVIVDLETVDLKASYP
jgi:hypothetical protein